MARQTIELLKGCEHNEEIVELLMAVASDFGDEIDDVSSLVVVPMKGGMTNEVFQINWPTKSDGHIRKVLVRLYGEGVDIFFKREDEIHNFEWMSKHGQGPLLLGHFTSGRVEEFLNARTLSASDLRDPEISAMIATKMRDFHNLHVPGAKKPHIWQRLRNMLNHAKRLCSPKTVITFGLDNLHADINMLEVLLSEECEEIGFCHNDLQYGNIMMDEEQRTVIFIDYEFACHNPIAYDLAYHFCDMEGDYRSDQPHIIHTNKYPGQFIYGTPGVEERQRFIRIYLSADGNKPSNTEVEQLVNAAEKYTLPCYLFYGLWGLLWDAVSTIDFDCKEYAKQRFQQYWLKKPTVFDSDSSFIISQDGIVNSLQAPLT